jgi:Fe2+ transport system protein FeoA
MRLVDLRPEDRAIVTSLDGGPTFVQKLNLRGVSEGSLLRVISSLGPVTVEVDRNTVCIGTGMAERIEVRRI